MVEYIDREAAIAIIEEKQKELCPVGRYGRGYVYGTDIEKFDALDKIINDLENIPAADIAEVYHARWEEADWHEYDAQSGETISFPKAAIVCSNCRNAFKKDALWKRNSCPNCGAKMDTQNEPEN